MLRRDVTDRSPLAWRKCKRGALAELPPRVRCQLVLCKEQSDLGLSDMVGNVAIPRGISDVDELRHDGEIRKKVLLGKRLCVSSSGRCGSGVRVIVQKHRGDAECCDQDEDAAENCGPAESSARTTDSFAV